MSTEPENTDEEDELPEDVSPENAERCLASLPPEIQSSIKDEADAQAVDMIHKFEAHAMQYERDHPDTAPSKTVDATISK
jgi:hypothetical protein